MIFIVVLSQKEWGRNTGERRERDKVTKGVKEMKKGGRVRKYERNHSLLYVMYYVYMNACMYARIFNLYVFK
jgi:hypothetical protein